MCVLDESIPCGFSSFARRVHLGVNSIASLSQASLPPPLDPRLLALHAAWARAARMSGAAEFLDELDRDVEALKVLAVDGSSAELFNMLILYRIAPNLVS